MIYHISKPLIAIRNAIASKGTGIKVAISTNNKDLVTLTRGYPNL